MSSYIEEQLMAGMRDEVAGSALSSDVLGAATRRHHRRTVVLRAAYAAGVAGLAGVTAVAVTLKPEVTPRMSLSQAIAGDITIGADKRIATVVYTRTIRATKDNVSAGSGAIKVTMAFSDYGPPVKVEKPANPVMVK